MADRSVMTGARGDGRIPRGPLLIGMYVLTLTLLIGGFAQEGSAGVAIAIVRVVVMAGLTLAFQLRRLSHRSVEVVLFVVLVLIAGIAQLSVGERSPQGAAISMMMAATLLMALGLVIVRDGQQGRMLAFVFVVCTVSPVLAHAAGEPALYSIALLYLLLMAGLLRAIEAVARRAQVADELAQTDPLTGLLNRRGVKPYLETAAADRRLSVLLMLDLDRFKALNDTQGHDAGDVVLQQVGSILRSGTRAGDRCSRWGGEEFLVLLPDTSLDMAVEIAERLRKDVRAATAVSTSVGVAGENPSDRLQDWIQRADEALYEAKARGRDQVVVGGARARPQSA